MSENINPSYRMANLLQHQKVRNYIRRRGVLEGTLEEKSYTNATNVIMLALGSKTFCGQILKETGLRRI